MTTHRFAPKVFHNTIGSHAPALTIASGDTVITETIDAGGTDASGTTRSPGPNPMNGPIYIEGAAPGDVLRVTIDAMRPTRATGWTINVLAANVVDPEAVRGLPPRQRTTWSIDRNAL